MARAAFTNLRPAELAGIGLGLAGLYFAVRPCRDLPAVGQEEESDADKIGQAAGKAAFNEAQNSDFPPTRDDTGNIGGAAANAGCHAAAAATYGATEIAAQLGWCSAIGEVIGKAIYDIFDGFFAGETYVAPQYDYIMAKRLRAASARIAKLSGNTWQYEAGALAMWGVPGATLITLHGGAGAYGSERGPWLPYYSEQGLLDYLALLAAAEAARTAQIVATKQALESGAKAKADSGGGVVLAAAGLGAVALWALF